MGHRPEPRPRKPAPIDRKVEIPEAAWLGLRSVGDSSAFEVDGFKVRVRVEEDDTGLESPCEGHEEYDESCPKCKLVDGLGLVVEVSRHVTWKPSPTGVYHKESDVVLGGSALWGIDGLDDDYARDLLKDLVPEALAHARGVLEALAKSREAWKARTKKGASK